MNTWWLSLYFMTHIYGPSWIRKLNLQLAHKSNFSEVIKLPNSSFFSVVRFLVVLTVYRLFILNNCNLPCSCLMWVIGDVWATQKFFFRIRMCFFHHCILFSFFCLFIYFFIVFSFLYLYMCIYLIINIFKWCK